MTVTTSEPQVAPFPTGVQRLPMAKAITLALRRAMLDDDRVMLMGEDIGRLGGVFRVTDGLHALHAIVARWASAATTPAAPR